MSETKIDPRQIKLITAAIVGQLLADGAVIAAKLKQGMTKSEMDGILANASISAAKLYANGGAALTEAELSYLKGVTSAIQTQLNARFLTSNFIGTPNTAQWTSTTIAVSAKAILDKINELIVTNTVPAVNIYSWSELGVTVQLSGLKKGDMLIYDSGTPPTGHILEVGDIIFAKKAAPSLSVTADWIVAQANLTGAVTSAISSVTGGALAVFSGTSGKVITQLSGSGTVKLVSGVATLVPDGNLSKDPIRVSHVGDGATMSFQIASIPSTGIGLIFQGIVSLNGQVLTPDIDYTVSFSSKLAYDIYIVTLSNEWFVPTSTDRIEIFGFL